MAAKRTRPASTTQEGPAGSSVAEPAAAAPRETVPPARPASSGGTSRGRAGLPSLGTPASSVAGFLLALVIWGWVVMPFIEDGPAGVKKVLRAKFLNQTPDGKWLP